MPEDRQEPILARIAVILLLANAFVWAGMRNVDILIVTLTSTLLALVGLVAGYRARKRIRRYGGRIPGEAIGEIGYWGNLVVFVGASLLFSYAVAMGVLRGDLL